MWHELGVIAPYRSDAAAARQWLIVGSVIRGQILTGLDMSTVNVALPYVQDSFHVSVDRISWVVAGYFAAIGIIFPLLG
jgi:MFS family permease